MPAVADTSDKINKAVADCLAQCYAQSSPFSTVVSYLNNLRNQPGWQESEVLSVERTVLRMLKAMLENDDNVTPEPPN